MPRKSIHGPISLERYRSARAVFLAIARRERAQIAALGSARDGIVWLAVKHRKALDAARRSLAGIRRQYAEGLVPPPRPRRARTAARRSAAG